MANGPTHILVGVIAGTGAAVFKSKGQETPCRFLEAAGGALGGYLGGKLPDILEPATSSWHRSTAHSFSAAAVVATGLAKVDIFQNYCRRRADSIAAVRATMPEDGGLGVLLQLLAEAFWRLCAGFAAGLAAGYLSHLALDALSPRCIPII